MRRVVFIATGRIVYNLYFTTTLTVQFSRGKLLIRLNTIITTRLLGLVVDKRAVELVLVFISLKVYRQIVLVNNIRKLINVGY